MKRWIVAVLVAVGLTAGTLAVAPAAHAVDRRPCVSEVEFYSLLPYSINVFAKTGHHITRDLLEAHWETRSFHKRNVLGLGEMSIYRRCGYSLDEAWAGVAYTKSGRAWAATRWTSPTATLHGKP